MLFSWKKFKFTLKTIIFLNISFYFNYYGKTGYPKLKYIVELCKHSTFTLNANEHSQVGIAKLAGKHLVLFEIKPNEEQKHDIMKWFI